MSQDNESVSTATTSTATRRNAPRSKYWCFTLNNYTPADEQRIKALEGTTGIYVVYGREVGENGTPHLQGFISFPDRKRMTYVKNKIGQCHFSMARMVKESIAYCKKDGDVVEFGVPPQLNGGKRNDLEKFKEDVKAGMLDIKEIREKHSLVYARFKNFCHEYIRDQSPRHMVEPHPLRKWQAELNRTLNGPVDKRKIIFLVDYSGSAGKSWFFRYYEQNHGDKCQIILPGKKQDMAYVLKETNRVVFFDCPKSKQGEYIQYDFLEEVKNGNVFQGKYESREKRFPSPHVVVAMNEMPNESLLSADRYDIRVFTSADLELEVP